ncbi:MAG: aminoglycoside phosphotransferase family protein [Chloroflexi bacterium]|nr:aminoglycoside phosphotransferase family protein [Chloroflexota bacterium]
MHADEVVTDVALVRRLLAEHYPRWADLPITPVTSAGTDNALYRLGDELVARLPRIHWAAGQAEKEFRWLPRLAPHLPLTIPTPLALGAPDAGYPWAWAIYRWLDGENATIDRLADPRQAALDLAQFVAALQRIDPAGGPLAGAHNSTRGVPLAARDAPTRAALAALAGMIDTGAATAAWDAALRAPAWPGPPVWIHGDLSSGNLLAVQGRLSAVIDFGCLGIGDPAADLIVAWNLFTAEARTVFRAALAVDDATWARGRGWALSTALIALPYYHVTNPVLAGIARHAIAEVLEEYRQGG